MAEHEWKAKLRTYAASTGAGAAGGSRAGGGAGAGGGGGGASPYTHTSLGGARGAFCVTDDRLADFFEAYKRAMIHRVPLHMTEKPRHHSPMRIDLDLHFALPADHAARSKRPYDRAFVDRVVQVYTEVLSELIDADDDAFTAYVTERPAPREDRGRQKDGLHVMWPALLVAPELQHLVRRRVLLRAREIFGGLPLLNDVDKVVDDSIIRNCWQMYGSTKEGVPPYQVTQVYRWEGVPRAVVRGEPPPSAEEELGFVELLSLRNKPDAATPLHAGKDAELREFARTALPALGRDGDREKLLNLQYLTSAINQRRSRLPDGELQFARELVKALSPERAETYESWIKVGFLLHNLDHRLLDDWIAFSALSSKFVAGECERIWDRLQHGTLSMGSLHLWARMDSPETYKRLCDASVYTLVDRIADMNSHYDVAVVVHALLSNRYRFVGGQTQTWYKYDDLKYRWVRTLEGLVLRKELSSVVCPKFIERANHWMNLYVGEHDENAKNKYKSKYDMYMAIASKLKTAGYKSSIMTECKALFADETFEERLDSHPHLMGFTNGVYDFAMKEFRTTPSPDDYISFSTGRAFTAYNPTSDDAKELNAYFAQVFVDPDVRSYMLDILAQIIDGSLRVEKFYICTGSGSNSKSVLMTLFQKAMGDYYGILPVSLITQKRAASNAAQAELERMRGRRIGVAQEPSEQDGAIQLGFMKELTGGDRIVCRKLFSNPIEFRPQFKMLLCCNDLPEVPGSDMGTWRRIRVIEFMSRFVPEPNPADPLQFPMDTGLVDKLDRWADTLIAMLIDRHARTDLKGIKEPLQVRIATEGYKQNNDVIGQYVADRIMRSAEEHLLVTQVYQEFRRWAMANVPKSRRTPDQPNVKAYFEKVFGPYGRKGWRIAFKPIVDDDDDANDDDDDESVAGGGEKAVAPPTPRPVV